MISTAIPQSSLESPQPQSLGRLSTCIGLVMLGLVVTVVGGLGPASVRPVLGITSIFLLITLTTLLVALSNRQELSRHLGYVMMLFGAFYWFISPAFFMTLNGADVGDRYGMMLRPQSITLACIYVAIYVFCGVVAYWWCYPVADAWVRRPTNMIMSNKLYWMIIGLFLAGFVPYALFGGSIEATIQAILAGRSRTPDWKAGALGDERSAIYYVSRSGMVAAAGFAGTWAVLARSAAPRLLLLTMFAFTSLLVFLDGGTRSWVALAVVPTFIAWIATTMQQRLTLSRILLCVLVVCGLQMSFEIARAARNRGWDLERIRTIDASKRHFDNDFFTDLAVSVDLVPKRHEYFHFGDIWAFISHPVPRFLWKEKPISPVLVYYNDAVHSGLFGKKGNKLPSHIGQFHMSFGMLGVIAIGLLSGLIGAFSSSMLQSRFVAVCHFGALLAIWWFLMGRGLYPGWIYVVVFTWLILLLGFRHERSVRPSHASMIS